MKFLKLTQIGFEKVNGGQPTTCLIEAAAIEVVVRGIGVIHSPGETPAVENMIECTTVWGKWRNHVAVVETPEEGGDRRAAGADMTLDVCILAGGLGTRLKGVWDGPKCLAPVAGRPIIERLVNRALALTPRKVFLLLSHRADEIIEWQERYCLHSYNVMRIIEPHPAGTLQALQTALTWGGLLDIQTPLLVLHGDTLPLYDLADLVRCARIHAAPIMAAWCGDRYAGAAMFDAAGLDQVRASEHADLDRLLSANFSRYHVCGYLDIGTPENFRRAQHMREEDL